ncbi:phenylalanine--tRNA ligase subunit alpha [Starmerella bacillaris]|uniref:Phenylalanine--tRNA ligase alpha subunit n=1 Tax=Starmerella bacillaris TaxID=1247836 RepID=A0AAV5RG13_STABA|nr:phenylalanine--tRNA ligase subunit alpha [Starmerella bacillaris]
MSLIDRILTHLDKEGAIESTSKTFPDVASVEVQSAVASLADKDMIKAEQVEHELWTLTEEGREILANGSHEIRLFDAVTKAVDGLAIADVSKIFGNNGRIGQQRAFKNGWIQKDGAKLIPKLQERPVDTTSDELKIVEQTGSLENQKVLDELKKRKLVTKNKVWWFKINKGPEFALVVPKYETDLTVEMLQSGAWKTAKFKKYNFKAEGTDPDAGSLHPLNKVRAEFRQIFFNMGFTEMSTDPYVDTGFWNFDALYVPQQHPARDLQDTFYIKDPVEGKLPEDKEYLERVKNAHEGGHFGSRGYGYKWDVKETQKLVLRTHTTAVSTKMLYELAKDPKPARYFSIDRVFRNEAVDATHLAEFHQIEGVIADYNITLGDLIGFMQKFFAMMGVEQLRFKPAYNPYTEPSLEIYGYHNGLGKWVEIGNSGLFRPEMLLPMGLPEEMRVIGFGLSLERPTMIKYAVSNIRELLGHKVDLNFIETNAAVRFDEKLV